MLLAELEGRAFARRDVLEGGEPAAIGHRLDADVENAAVGEVPGEGIAAVGLHHVHEFAGDVLRRSPIRMDAAGDAALDHLDHGHARPDIVLLQPVDLEIAAVADHDAHVPVIDAEALRHAFQGGVEQEVLLLHLREGPGPLDLGAPQLRDVLEHAEPAAIRHGLDGDGDDAAIVHVLVVASPVAAGDRFETPGDELVGGHPGIAAELNAVREDIPQGDARLHHGGIGAEEGDVVLVADDQALVRVEHAQRLGHGVERGVEAPVLLVQLLDEGLALRHVLGREHPAAAGHGTRPGLDPASVGQLPALVDLGARRDGAP